jgi:hypothetical protein
MQKLEVLIEENAYGAVRPVEVVADVPVSALVPALVEELKLPQTDLFGKKLVYMLRHAPKGTVLPEHQTLIGSGVEPGALLILDSYVADGNAADLLNFHVQTGNAVPDPQLYSSPTIADMSAFGSVARDSTSGRLSAAPRKSGTTRRAFLILGGAAFAVAAGGVGFAGYRALQNNNKMAASTRVAQPTKTTVKPTQVAKVPTMATSQFVFKGHQGTVRTVGWSQDGTMLASGADDKLALIWGTDGVVRHRLQHPGSVHTLAWAADNQRVVTGSNNQVAFFNAVNGNMLARSTQHTAAVSSLAWAAHGQMQVVSGAVDTHAIVWNTTNYQAQTTFRKHTSSVESVTWDASGKTVASVSIGGAARVWNAADGKELHGYYQDANTPTRAVAFAPNGMQLAVGGNDGVVRLWNGLACQQQGNGTRCMDGPQRLADAHKPIRVLTWSPDARFLAVGSEDGTLIVWYPAQSTTKPLFKLQQAATVRSIAWSPDGKKLASVSGNTVTIWGLV